MIFNLGGMSFPLDCPDETENVTEICTIENSLISKDTRILIHANPLSYEYSEFSIDLEPEYPPSSIVKKINKSYRIW